MTNTLKITPGVWSRNIKPPIKYVTIFAGRNTHIAHMATGPELSDTEIEANCTLIAEAGTVANETGLMPREMAGQRAELLEALQDIINCFKDKDTPGMKPLVAYARAAIATSNPKEPV